MADTVYAPDRIKKPLIRTGKRGEGVFKEISWENALDLVAGKLTTIREKHGSMSVLPMNGSGSCRAAIHNSTRLGRRFFSMYGGFVDRKDSYSSAAADYTAKALFGTKNVGLDADTLKKSRFIILWGANICSARLFNSRMESIIAKRRNEGIEIVVIDPRLSRTAKKIATQWIKIRPGTDCAMMAAMLYTIIDKRILDTEYIDKYTVGFDDLITYIKGLPDGIRKNPGWASEICGVPPSTIIKLASFHPETGIFGRAKFPKKFLTVKFKKNIHGYQKRT